MRLIAPLMPVRAAAVKVSHRRPRPTLDLLESRRMLDATLSISDVTITEGTGGNATADFVVSLSESSPRFVAAKFSTAAQTASTKDFTKIAGLLTFNPGELTKTISVPIVTDNLDEANERFSARLSAPNGAKIARGQAFATIGDDDASPTFVMADVSLAEGVKGNRPATFTVNLSNPSSRAVTVRYATAPGTATANGDFVSKAGTLRFAPGKTSALAKVNVKGDSAAEDDETFLLTLSSPVGGLIADPSAIGTILDDDGFPRMNIGDATVSEGNTGTTDLNFAVTLSTASTTAVTATYATTAGTADASDVTAATGTVTFAPGQTSQNITIKILGDNIVETNESFSLDLSSAVGAHIDTSHATGTIQNDDTLIVPAISVSDVTVNEGNAGTTNAVVTVSLAQAANQTVTVDYATADGTAGAGSDYTSALGTLTFAPGETEKQITLLVSGDSGIESTETFAVNLSNAVNGTIADAQGIITITNDDFPPIIPAVSIGDASIAEGNSGTSNATIMVSLSVPTTLSVQVGYSTDNATAVAPGDYTAVSGILTFAPGEVSKPIIVPIVGDTSFESNESLVVNLTTVTNGTIFRPQGVLAIINDDTAPVVPVISIDDVSIGESDAGNVTANVAVHLSQATTQTVTVNYATANDTATTANSDYVAAIGTVTFTPGQTSQTITISVVGDTNVESNETFFVNLTGPNNGTLGDTQAIVTITNDDTPPVVPVITIDDVSIGEGNSGNVTANVAVHLSQATTQTVTVNYVTANNTATIADFDYLAAGATLTFAPGETAKTIPLSVVGDTNSELNETFFVNLTSPNNGTLGDAQAIVTITDDDAPVITISDLSITEGNAGTKLANVTVSLSHAAAQDVTVNFATLDGTATTADNDYLAAIGTLTFTSGQTSQDIAVTLNGDTTLEPNESFFVSLASPTNATIGDGQATVTITNDDLPSITPDITINNVSVAEGNTGTANVNITVSLSAATALTVMVGYSTADDTAANPGDYTSASGTLTFAPGETSKLVPLLVKGDFTFESDETFFVDLSSPSNGNITDSQGVVTITDDDTTPPEISVDQLFVLEGSSGTPTTAQATVRLDKTYALDVTVEYSTTDGSATTADDDYTLAVSSVTIPAGQTTATIDLTIVSDTTFEADETFFVTLFNPTNGSISTDPTSGLITITNDDAPPGIVIGDAGVSESTGITQQMIFSVTIPSGISGIVTVDYTTVGGTATSNSDFTPVSGTLTFLPGQTSKDIFVDIPDDDDIESTETFTVVLSNASGAPIVGTGIATGTILDEDGPVIFGFGNALPEGASGNKNLTFTFYMLKAQAQDVTFDFTTVDDLAVASQDYQATSGTLTIPAGQTQVTVNVPLFGDTSVEADENFFVQMSNPVNGTFGLNDINAIIVNDDNPGVDLVIDSLDYDPSGDYPEQSIAMTLTLRNTGDTASDPTTLFLEATDAPAGISPNRILLTVLDAGTMQPLTISSLAPGEVRLISIIVQFVNPLGGAQTPDGIYDLVATVTQPGDFNFADNVFFSFNTIFVQDDTP